MTFGVTRDLFAELQKLIPGLPDRITQLDLKMNAGSVPVVTCQFLIETAGKVSTDSKTFEIREMSREGE